VFAVLLLYATRLIDYNMAKRDLGAINWPIWDKTTRWEAIGGLPGKVRQLRAMYDKESDEFDGEKYREWQKRLN
jgi:hypothetical protein